MQTIEYKWFELGEIKTIQAFLLIGFYHIVKQKRIQKHKYRLSNNQSNHSRQISRQVSFSMLMIHILQGFQPQCVALKEVYLLSHACSHIIHAVQIRWRAPRTLLYSLPTKDFKNPVLRIRISWIKKKRDIQDIAIQLIHNYYFYFWV